MLAESIFRAGRWGTQAQLIDTDGEHRQVADVVEATLERLADVAVDLDCTAELNRLPELVAAGGGAGRQRSIFRIAGIEAVTRTLAQRTAASCESSAEPVQIP